MIVLIIGLGSIARKHIKALQDLNIDIILYAYREKGHELVPGVQNIFSLTEIEPSFVLITNPTYSHFKMIEYFSEKGVNIFVEKPVTNLYKNIIKLESILKRKNLISYVGCNLRFHPINIYLKQLLEDKMSTLNEVNIYCGSYLPNWRGKADFRQSYSSFENLGGGVHLDVFHEFDTAYYLFGMPINSKIFKSSKSSLKIQSVDYCNSIFEYEKFNTSIILNYYRKIPKRSIEIVFEDGVLIADYLKCSINFNGEVIFENPKYELQDSYKVQMKYFLSHLNSKTQPINSIGESLKILKLIINK